MMHRRIKPSYKARDQLLKIKRLTGLQHWNEICRWGFCLSLAEPTSPSQQTIEPESNIDMTWHQFGGDYYDIYYALLKERCHRDSLGIDEETLEHQFRLHLHRGVSYLAADRQLQSIADIINQVSTTIKK